MKKRLAICVSGHVRTMYHALPLSLEVIRRSNPNLELDVYAALWDKHDGRVPNKINDPNHYTADTHVTSEMLTEVYIESWLKTLVGGTISVKMLDSETIDKHLQDGLRLIGSVDNHLMPQYFSTSTCLNMVNPEQYLYVVRIRPDIVINSFPDLTAIDIDLITNSDMWYNAAAGAGYENEMIWVVSTAFAHVTGKLYDSLHAGKHPGGPTYGEAMTGRQFLGIPCRKTRFNFDCRVAR